jgi:hypothetical protein
MAGEARYGRGRARRGEEFMKIDYPYDFQRLWKAYPLKVNKGAALRAFEKLKPNTEDVDSLIEHLEERKRLDAKWIEGKYIPHLSSWLNGHRWEDAYPKVRKTSPSHKPFQAEEVPYRPADPEMVRRELDALRKTLH